MQIFGLGKIVKNKCSFNCVKINTCTITFDPMGGKMMRTSVPCGNDAFFPSVAWLGFGPEEQNATYEHDGWWTGPYGGSKIDTYTLQHYTSNITLYAHWKVKQGLYRIVTDFDPNYSCSTNYNTCDFNPFSEGAYYPQLGTKFRSCTTAGKECYYCNGTQAVRLTCGTT